MPSMQSAAMALLVPAGSSVDPIGGGGTACVLADLLLRGAGDRDSRALTDHLDSLGLQRSCAPSVFHMRMGCAALASRVLESVGVYADILQRPHLPEEGFIAARDLALQSLEGLEDDPRQKVLIEMRKRFFPFPLGRSSMGEKEDLQGMTLATCREHFNKTFRANGAIISLAGKIEFAEAKDLVEQYFSRWIGGSAPNLPPQPAKRGVHHLPHPSEQTHIGIAFDSVDETHPDTYVVRLAMEALGGGMSSRLFTEVREKKGLVYSIWAGYTPLKGLGAIMGYAGTSNDRAQNTLDAFLVELERMSKGIEAAELDRAKIGLKASIIMSGESTSARAGAIAHDYFIHGAIRSLEDIKAAIDAVTLDRVNDYLKANPPGNYTIVTVGPKSLKI